MQSGQVGPRASCVDIDRCRSPQLSAPTSVTLSALRGVVQVLTTRDQKKGVVQVPQKGVGPGSSRAVRTGWSRGSAGSAPGSAEKGWSRFRTAGSAHRKGVVPVPHGSAVPHTRPHARYRLPAPVRLEPFAAYPARPRARHPLPPDRTAAWLTPLNRLRHCGASSRGHFSRAQPGHFSRAAKC